MAKKRSIVGQRFVFVGKSPSEIRPSRTTDRIFPSRNRRLPCLLLQNSHRTGDRMTHPVNKYFEDSCCVADAVFNLVPPSLRKIWNPERSRCSSLVTLWTEVQVEALGPTAESVLRKRSGIQTRTRVQLSGVIPGRNPARRRSPFAFGLSSLLPGTRRADPDVMSRSWRTDKVCVTRERNGAGVLQP